MGSGGSKRSRSASKSSKQQQAGKQEKGKTGRKSSEPPVEDAVTQPSVQGAGTEREATDQGRGEEPAGREVEVATMKMDETNGTSKNGAAKMETIDENGATGVETERRTATAIATQRDVKTTANPQIRRDKSDSTASQSSVSSSRQHSRARPTSFYETVDAAEILPYLVVGNLASARNPAFLKRKNIAFVLNLTTDGEWGAGAPGGKGLLEGGLVQLQVPIEDDEDEEISGHFQVCFDFINRAKVASVSSSDKRHSSALKAVLVHSNYGLSRTSAIVLAYLMKEKQWLLRQAYEHLRSRHASAKPNDGFVVQLLRYEQEVHGRMSMTLKNFYQQP